MGGGGGRGGVQVCMAGGHGWQRGAGMGGSMCGGGPAWQGGTCVVGGMCGRGACMVGEACMPCMPPQTPRDTVGQCAGGTHPTGMHSC